MICRTDFTTTQSEADALYGDCSVYTTPTPANGSHHTASSSEFPVWGIGLAVGVTTLLLILFGFCCLKHCIVQSADNFRVTNDTPPAYTHTQLNPMFATEPRRNETIADDVVTNDSSGKVEHFYEELKESIVHVATEPKRKDHEYEYATIAIATDEHLYGFIPADFQDEDEDEV